MSATSFLAVCFPNMKHSYDYYKPFTTHDSSLSPAGHTLVANRLGRVQEVREFLESTLAVDLSPDKRGAENGIHIANCGALWQTVVHGFAGVKPGYLAQKIEVSPILPPHIQSLSIPYQQGDKKVTIRATHSGTEIIPRNHRHMAFLFDLDGVLTDTAQYHFQAWKRLSNELGLKFTQADNELLKGVSRRRSFEIILEQNHALGQYSDAEIDTFIEKKNDYYHELIQQITPDSVLPGVLPFLEVAKRRGILLAVASASRNAQEVLHALGIAEQFDYIADASKVTRVKPDPEVFLDCAAALGVHPADCVGFEDAQAGIEAIKAAGMTAVGIHVAITSLEPDFMLNSTRDLSPDSIGQFIGMPG